MPNFNPVARVMTAGRRVAEINDPERLGRVKKVQEGWRGQTVYVIDWDDRTTTREPLCNLIDMSDTEDY